MESKIAAWVLLCMFIGCGADVTVHGVPKEIKLTAGCAEPADAGVE